MVYIINNFRGEFQLFAMLAILAASLRWGAGPERASAFVFSSFFWMGPLTDFFNDGGNHFLSVRLGSAAIDLAVGILFVLIALWSNRIYPLCLAAFQVMAFASHLIRDLSNQISAMAYFALAIGPSYLQIFTLAGGIWFHRKRVKRFGPYRSWRISSRLLQALDPKGYPKN